MKLVGILLLVSLGIFYMIGIVKAMEDVVMSKRRKEMEKKQDGVGGASKSERRREMEVKGDGPDTPKSEKSEAHRTTIFEPVKRLLVPEGSRRKLAMKKVDTGISGVERTLQPGVDTVTGFVGPILGSVIEPVRALIRGLVASKKITEDESDSIGLWAQNNKQYAILTLIVIFYVLRYLLYDIYYYGVILFIIICGICAVRQLIDCLSFSETDGDRRAIINESSRDRRTSPSSRTEDVGSVYSSMNYDYRSGPGDKNISF